MIYYKIINITDKQGNIRTDGRYPQRVNSVVTIELLEVGSCFFYNNVLDNEGNDKEGRLRTSAVMSIRESLVDKTLAVETMNSVFYLEPILTN